ncbi:son of sevenless homolog 1-like [Styela clava]
MALADACIDLEKCKGLLLPGLSKIQQQHHNSLPLTSRGGNYLAHLLLKLLASLLSSQPKNVQDAKEQVSRKFPEPLSRWALEEAESAQEKGKKKVAFSVDKLHHALKEHNPGMEKQVTLIFSGVLEYMASDILKLTTNYAKNILSNEITDQDIKIAMFADNVLMDVFHCDEMEEDMVVVPDVISRNKVEKHVSYESLVRDFMTEEASYLRDLNLIIKLIKKEFDEAPNLFSEKDIEIIFSNVGDLAELAVKLIGLLEEAVEMTDESCPVPLVGSCFEDLALECNFELYSDYTIAMMNNTWRESFDSILSRPEVTKHLQNVCHGFRDVVAYVLPNLLLAPIYHCFYYFEQIELLEKKSPDPEDRQCLVQALSAITPIKPILEFRTQSLPKLRPSEASLRISWRGGPRESRMSDIEKSIDGWLGRTISQSCNEFLHEGPLLRVGNKRSSDRHVFLFDFLMVSCKSNQARLPTVAAAYEYRLKERISVRKATVRDIIDEGGVEKNQFEILDGEKKESHIFQTKTKVDKRAWMSHLIRLKYRSTFDRMLDQIIREEAANQVLRLPTPDKYRFAEPDSNQNLILEENDTTSIDGQNNAINNNNNTQYDVIKGGTVLKLVERLTYHQYSDQGFSKTFLTTFRSFCKPKELLDLLIERYKIPEPPPTPEQQLAIDRGELPNREDLKRFRKEYLTPISLRVMNVIRQWLEHHWYDFDRDEELLAEVEKFIGSVRGKNMKKWARTMLKIIERKKKSSENNYPEFSFTEEAPPVEWNLTHDPSKFNLFTLHPIEIARQLTLIEFSLYRRVQPSELIGSVWTKVGKETNSPNLLKMIHFSTKITRWISKTIIEISNHDERLAAMNRAIEVMQVMKQLNNFNGLLEFVAAFNSSAVHRLNHTKESLSDRYSKIRKECMDMCDSRLTKTLERLRSIDPPCVPFVGTFLTNILKTEEGNPHLLPNYPENLELINFSKRRKVAAIMLEVQQYQAMPYNLTSVQTIKDFFINLDPLDGRTDKQFNDHLFHTSLKIEPREDRPPKFPRSFTDKEIKSPGTVPGKRHVSRTLTKEDFKNMDRIPIRRDHSLRLSNSDKRHSLILSPTQKRETFDTMSVRNFVFTDTGKTPSPKEEPPAPPRPPREPRSQSLHGIDLVSAPPTMSDRSRFNFDLSTSRLGPNFNNPLSGAPPLSAIPPTPATAPARSFTNGTHTPLESGQISPPSAQLDLGEPELIPPPLPPREPWRLNGGYSERHPLYNKNSIDRSSPPSTPPPIPPRDPPNIPPRAPVRSMPYSRNYDIQPGTPHINTNGGRYVVDPTWDPSPTVQIPYAHGVSNFHSFENLPQQVDPDPRVTTVVTPTAFDFTDFSQSLGGTPPRGGWVSGGAPAMNEHPRFTSNDAPPPIPRRQPSSTT